MNTKNCLRPSCSTSTPSFFLAKLKCYTESQNGQYILNQEFNIGDLMGQIFTLISKDPFQQNPLFLIYQLIVQITKQPDEALFYTVKQLIFTNASRFGVKERANLFVFLINYANGRLLEGQVQYQMELFELYKEGLEKQFLIEFDLLPTQHFINATILSLELGQTAWLANFIDQYSPYLPQAKRSKFITLSQAYAAFYKSDFSKSIQLLSIVDFDDISDKLIARSLLLRNYYDANDSYLLIRDYCQGYIGYLNYDKQIGTQHKEANRNFVKFVKQLAAIREQSGQGKVTSKTQTELQSILSECELIICKKWLLQKIIELPLPAS